MSSNAVLDEERQSERKMLGRGIELIFRQLRRAPWEFGLGLGATTFFAGATVVSSYLIGWATDSVLLPAAQRGEMTTASLVGVALALVATGAAKALGISLRRYGAFRAVYRLEQKDRTDVTDQYLKLPIEWHRRHPTGQLLSNVNADVEAAAFIAAPLPMAFGVLVMLAITCVLLIFTDLFLALVGFSIIPAIMGNNLYYQKRMRVAAASSQRIRAEVSEAAHESFDAALVVKTLGREDQETERFGALSDRLRQNMVKIGRLRSVFDPMMEALPTIGVLAVVGVGAWRVDQGLMTAGTLVTFAYLFRLITMPMRVFAWLLSQLPMGAVGLDRIEAVLSERQTVTYGREGFDRGGGADTEALDVSYLHPATELADLDSGPTRSPPSTLKPAGDGDKDRRGVESITFRVPPARKVALVGSTGSGKSTVAQLLVRLFDPDTGYVRLDRVPLPELSRSVIGGSAILVFQEPFLFNATVRENITLGGDYEEEEVEASAQLAQAHQFISDLADGYDTLIGERGANLSGGQRQRIALARALVRQPRLLVLDDATSAVDPAVEKAILDGLAVLDTTVIMVAYRRASIITADEVIFIEEGSIAGRGSHDELYTTLPVYAALIDAYEIYETRPANAETGRGVRDGWKMTVLKESGGRPKVAAWQTMRRGLSLSPELRRGLIITMVLALLATVGRVIIPVAIQQVLDRGLTDLGVDMGFVGRMIGLALVAVLITASATGVMHLRLARVSEEALSGIRIRAFRHIHDLSMLHQAAEQRGVLVSRVTSDVDQISRFMQWAGLMLIVNTGQALMAVVVMALYSWQLFLTVMASLPLIIIVILWHQKRLAVAYLVVRERVGQMLGALAEVVVGAPVIRAYGIEDRMRAKLARVIENHRKAASRAGGITSSLSGASEMIMSTVIAAVVVVGAVLVLDGGTSFGTVVAFLFLVQLFIQPVQLFGEAVNEALTAVAGWKRVLDVLDIPPDVADPGPEGVDLASGPLEVQFENVSFRYPIPGEKAHRASGVLALEDVNVAIASRTHVAVVGETGSGKTTFAKLTTRLMDPTDGRVLLGGAEAAHIRFESLRKRMIMVPQDGMLFRGSILDNVRMGKPGASEAEAEAVFRQLGLGGWLAELNQGLDTQVGERGSALSVGERQLVTLARAAIADPDLLVLDEATSAVDPFTEVRISRALEELTTGRTVITIAHRLSTAEIADRVLVFDGGRVVQDGVHADLLAEGGVYGRLYEAWQRGTSETTARSE